MPREFTSGDIAALQAFNPEYNTTIADALQFTAALAALGFHAVQVIAQTQGGPAATGLVSLQELVASSVKQDVPLNIGAQFDGAANFHNLGLLRRIFNQYDALSAYAQVFNDVYGNADNWGQTATNRLLSVASVKAAVVAQINSAFGKAA
jgi:hypothetical protein